MKCVNLLTRNAYLVLKNFVNGISECLFLEDSQIYPFFLNAPFATP